MQGFLDGALRLREFASSAETARRLGFEAKPLKGTTAVLDPARLENPAEAGRWIQHHLSEWPSWINQFTLKPRFGSSGRGRTGGRREALDRHAIEKALPRLAQRGGALLEPWVDRIRDLSVALHLAPLDTVDGPAVTLLGSLEAITLPSGVPLGFIVAMDSTSPCRMRKRLLSRSMPRVRSSSVTWPMVLTVSLILYVETPALVTWRLTTN